MKKNLILRKYRIFILGILLFLIVGMSSTIWSEEMGAIDKWFDWKIKHLDTKKQKAVISYFEKIYPIFNDASSIEWRPIGASPEYPAPEKAVKIIDESLNKIKELSPPEICNKHYEVTVNALECIRDYQMQRIKAGTDEIFEAKRKQDNAYEIKIRDIKLKESRLEEEMQKEYYVVLRKVGFYDNAASEMFNLKFITKEEKEQLEKEKK